MKTGTKEIIRATLRAVGTIPLAVITEVLRSLDGKTEEINGDTPSILVNQSEAARLLCVSRFTVRRCVQSGVLRQVHVRGAVRYRRSDLERIAVQGAGMLCAEGGINKKAGNKKGDV